MSLFSKLFGGGGKSEPEARVETYEGFRISARPIAEGNSYRICALIEKEVDGETLSHELIRADTVQSAEDARAMSVRKAKQAIDEQGERLLRKK